MKKIAKKLRGLKILAMVEFKGVKISKKGDKGCERLANISLEGCKNFFQPVKGSETLFWSVMYT